MLSDHAAGAVIRWWWAPLTVSAATVGGALWLTLEALLGHAVRTGDLGRLIAAHVVSAIVTSLVLALLSGLRATRRYADRSNPFWAGVGYGCVAALASGIVAGVTSAQAGVPTILGALWFSALTMEFLLMCLIGALAWGWLVLRRSRTAGG